MPETRDIHFSKRTLFVNFSSGANPVGAEAYECRTCGALVLDTKQHNRYHKDLTSTLRRISQ